MSNVTRVGIIGAGWPGQTHAKAMSVAGGFKIVAVSDPLPAQRRKLVADASIKQHGDWKELLEDKELDAVIVCVPNDLHAEVTIAALRAGKHVLCETPPAMNAKEASKIESAAEKHDRVLMYAFQRRFGGAEMAARLSIEKGFIGEVRHVRASWMRTRGIPAGTGWFTDRARSGGGAIMDLGIHMLDLAWHLLGEPSLTSVFAVTHAEKEAKTENAGFVLLRFEDGASVELSASWSINQPPAQQGTACRLYGTEGAIDLYTPGGATLYRGFSKSGECKSAVLKPPKVTHHVAMARHFRQCILGTAKPSIGPAQGTMLMKMIDAIYRSAETGRSVEVR